LVLTRPTAKTILHANDETTPLNTCQTAYTMAASGMDLFRTWADRADAEELLRLGEERAQMDAAMDELAGACSDDVAPEQKAAADREDVRAHWRSAEFDEAFHTYLTLPDLGLAGGRLGAEQDSLKDYVPEGACHVGIRTFLCSNEGGGGEIASYNKIELHPIFTKRVSSGAPATLDAHEGPFPPLILPSRQIQKRQRGVIEDPPLSPIENYSKYTNTQLPHPNPYYAQVWRRLPTRSQRSKCEQCALPSTRPVMAFCQTTQS
jgi:hypothetical protein